MLKSFNFGKGLLKKVTKKGGISKDKSQIDASKKGGNYSRSLLSNTSALIQTVIMPKEETEDEKVDRILKDIMKKYEEEKSSSTLATKDYCAADSKKEFSFITEMENTYKELSDFIFTSPREESESCQLVEKEKLDDLREQNNRYSLQIALLKDKINKKQTELFKAKGENNFVIQANLYQNAQEVDNVQQYELSSQLYTENLEKNKELKYNLTSVKIQRESLFKAVSFYLEKSDPLMATEFKSIYNKYNNQTYMMKTKPVDKQKVDELFRKIAVLQKTVNNKNKEIKSLEKITSGNKMKLSSRKGKRGITTMKANTSLQMASSS